MKRLNKTWCVTWDAKAKAYYVRANVYIDKNHNTGLLLHRAIMNKDNPNPQGVHHKFGDPLDNRKASLGFTSVRDNCRERIKLNSNNTSGARNVSWSNSYQKWLVQLQDENGKNKVWGKFEKDEFEQAKELARQLRKELYGCELESE